MPGKGWYIDNGGEGLCGSSQLSLMHWSIQVLPRAWSGLDYNVVDHLGGLFWPVWLTVTSWGLCLVSVEERHCRPILVTVYSVLSWGRP
jgi:hypothetical protein